MSTEVASDAKRLVYDGECPMCRASVAGLIRWGLVTADQTVSNQVLPVEDLEVAFAAGLRNQIVALEPHTRATRTGIDALLWMLQDNLRYRWLATLAGLPGIYSIVRAGYQMISYNRRIISPVQRQIACDCDPVVTISRRLTLLLPLTLVALISVGLFGAMLAYAIEVAVWRGALVAIATFGVPSLALMLLGASVLPAGKRLDYVSHLVVTLFAGSLVLLPGSLLLWLAPAMSTMFAKATLTASAAWMLLVQRRRVAVQGLTNVWLLIWAVATIGGGTLVAWLLSA